MINKKLDPEWEAELNRLGVDGVRDLLLKTGLDAKVKLQVPGRIDHPWQRDVQDWLTAKLEERERRDASVAWWTKCAAVAAIIAAALSFVGIVIGLLAWLDPIK